MWCRSIWISIGIFLSLTRQIHAQTIEKSQKIDSVTWEGLEKTNADWIRDYSGLLCPCWLSTSDLQRIRSKLLTTQVFQEVSLREEPSPSDPNQQNLIVSVREKWTVIPVVRGAFGGGTPLLVAGIYDTHAFGQLLTVGAETRKYGNAAPGGVAWIRAPRWRQGRHYWNLEIWKDERLRNFYDSSDKVTATLHSSASQIVGDLLFPLLEEVSPSWQYGVKILYRDQAKLDWKSSAQVDSVPLSTGPSRKIQARIVYDNLRVEGLQLEGLRTLFAGGPEYSDGSSHQTFEHELFAYKIWQQNLNLSWHHWLGMSDDVRYPSLFFLGGFDSIRGLPDGTLYGTKAGYSNLELRYLFHKAQYTWWQAAAYIDYGSAADSFSELEARDRLSIGTGLRIAIPQVNRLMFRFDFAWGITEPRTSSLSMGMNQFIDPYRPL